MRYYLDTSALVKRYIKEPGSEFIDGIFEEAFNGGNIIITSYWNIGEAAVVFDKYSRRTKTDGAIKLLSMMVDEFKSLADVDAIEISDLSNFIIYASIGDVTRHHIYIADALQLTTARKENAEMLLSADRELIDAAREEKYKASYIGDYK